MVQARRQATYEDIEALPPHVTGQIVAGQLYAHPRPRDIHTMASSTLGGLLGPFHERVRGPHEPGGWVFRDEPEVHLGADVLVPDLAGWRTERAVWPREAAYLEVVPDWICEILSPSTEAFDRSVKMPVYALHGVRHAWLLDPEARTLEVYELSAGVLRQKGPAFRAHVRVVAPPFEERGIEIWRAWE